MERIGTYLPMESFLRLPNPLAALRAVPVFLVVDGRFNKWWWHERAMAWRRAMTSSPVALLGYLLQPQARAISPSS